MDALRVKTESSSDGLVLRYLRELKLYCFLELRTLSKLKANLLFHQNLMLYRSIHELYLISADVCQPISISYSWCLSSVLQDMFKQPTLNQES